MKILISIFADVPNTAPGRRMHMLARGLSRHGCGVKLLAPMNFQGNDLTGEIEGVNVAWATSAQDSDVNSTAKRLAARLRFYRLLKEELRQGIDGVVFSNPNSDLLPGILLANRRGAFTFATYDDARRLKVKPSVADYLIFAAGLFCDRLIPRVVRANAATSTALRERVKRAAPHSEVFLFPPIVDTDQFWNNADRRAQCRSELGIKGEVVIGYLGTYWSIEGVRVLLEAVVQLKQAHSNTKVIICGKAHEGFECDNVGDIIQRLGLSGTVIEKGWLSKDKVIDVMSACDILAIPKIQDKANIAGMPAKLAEYMSMGKAIVTSRIGDIPLYVNDGKDCILCEPGDVRGVSNALVELVADAELRARLSAASRITAKKQFDCASVSERFLKQMVHPKSDVEICI